MKDTADDTVINGSLDVLSQQAAEMSEKITLNELKAASNVYRAGAVAARNLVATVFGLTEINRMVRGLLRQNAKKVTKAVRSTPDFNTDNVHPSFICIIPVELISTVRGLSGFIDAKDYGQVSPYPNEIGAVNEVRFLYHTLLTAYAGAGAAGSTYLATGGNYDVFPIVMFGADAYANVALRGEFAITPQVVNPKPVQGDPLGQRGSIGWKSMRAAKVLNDAWIACGESCAPL